MVTRNTGKKLKPAGHSAVIEALIQPAIVVGSTLMSAIAAYVLALDELTRILNRTGRPSDWFIVVLCVGSGFLVDMAIIVSATRVKMHTVRADPDELPWLRLARWVLLLGLASESMTMLYFFVHLGAQQFPAPLVALANGVHAVLAVGRAFLPPVIIAYFVAGVLPVVFDRSDRNREIKARTSSNIMLLVDRLSEVMDTDDKAEMLRALGGQLMLDTYATYDVTATTSEDDQMRRDTKLLMHLAKINNLNWDSIGVGLTSASAPLAGTAPGTASAEVHTPTRNSSEDAPQKPPTGPGTPTRRPVHTPRRKRTARPRVVALPQGGTYPAIERPAAEVDFERIARKAWAEGHRTIKTMEGATGMSHSAAQAWVRALKAEAKAGAANSGKVAR